MEAPAWELSKENVLPIKRGRSVKGLGQSSLALAQNIDAAVTGASTGSNKLNELKGMGTGMGMGMTEKWHDENKMKEKGFEDNIAGLTKSYKNGEDVGSELLEAYKNCIKWTRDTYISNTEKAMKLLERCTFELKDEANIKNSLQFVKMWIEYADMVRTPGEVFSFMLTNKIGEKVALYWVAYAFVAEKAGNFKLTDQVFQKGLRRQAEPKEVLQKRYQQFTRRLARHYLNKEAEDGSIAGEVKEESQRKALDTLAKTRHVNNENSMSTSTSTSTSRRAVTTSSSSSSSRTNTAANPNPNPNSYPNSNPTITQIERGLQNLGRAFQILEEPVVMVAGEIVAPSSSGSLDPSGGTWNNFGTEQQRRKENSGPVTKWSDGPLVTPLDRHVGVGVFPYSISTGASGGGGAVPSAVPSFPFFVDTEFQSRDADMYLKLTEAQAQGGGEGEGEGEDNNKKVGLSIRKKLDGVAAYSSSEQISRHPLTRHTASDPAPEALEQAVPEGGSRMSTTVGGKLPQAESKAAKQSKSSVLSVPPSTSTSTSTSTSAPPPAPVPTSMGFSIFSEHSMAPVAPAPAPPSDSSCSASSNRGKGGVRVSSKDKDKGSRRKKEKEKTSSRIISGSGASIDGSISTSTSTNANASIPSSSGFSIFSDQPLYATSSHTSTSTSNPLPASAISSVQADRKGLGGGSSAGLGFSIFSDAPTPISALAGDRSAPSPAAPAPAPAAPVATNKPIQAPVVGSRMGSGAPIAAEAVAVGASSRALLDTTSDRDHHDIDLQAMLDEMITLDGEDGTINTRLARKDIDNMFFSPDSSFNDMKRAPVAPVASLCGIAQVQGAHVQGHGQGKGQGQANVNTSTSFAIFQDDAAAAVSMKPAGSKYGHAEHDIDHNDEDEDEDEAHYNHEERVRTNESHGGIGAGLGTSAMNFSIFEDAKDAISTPGGATKGLGKGDKVFSQAVHRPFGMRVEEISGVKDLSAIRETSHEYSMIAGCIGTPCGDSGSYHSSSSSSGSSMGGEGNNNNMNSSYISSESSNKSNSPHANGTGGDASSMQQYTGV